MPARTVDDADRPRLARHVRLRFDRARGRHVLLAPEAVSVLNGTGATILGLCDGRRTVSEIVAELRAGYDRVDGAEVRDFIAGLVTRQCVEVGDGPVVDGPVVDGPVVDGPVVDGPVVDGPVGDGREAGDGRTG